MNEKSISGAADASKGVKNDFLALAADLVSNRAVIKQSSAQALMVAGFASDEVAKRSWSFNITDKDGDVRYYVECTGTDEFGQTEGAWRAEPKKAQSAYKRALQKVFFNLPDNDPAVWTMVSRAIPIARAIREECMTATVVNGELKLEGGCSSRADAMRSAASLSALSKIAQDGAKARTTSTVEEQTNTIRAKLQKPIVEAETKVDVLPPKNLVSPLGKVAAWLTRKSLAKDSSRKSTDPVLALSSKVLPSVLRPAEGTEKLEAEIDTSCGVENASVGEQRDFGEPEASKVRRGRGAGEKPAMMHVIIRLPMHVVERYPNLEAMSDEWVRYVENLSCSAEEKEIDPPSISSAQDESSGYGYSIRIIEKIESGDDSLLGVQLGKVCIANNISVSEVARSFGVTRQTVYSWFLGRSLPKGKAAASIRTFLDAEQIERIKSVRLV